MRLVPRRERHRRNGSPPAAPDAAHSANDKSLVDIVRNGIPGTEMPSFAIALTEQKAWQTAATFGRSAVSPRDRCPATRDAVPRTNFRLQLVPHRCRQGGVFDRS
jgi:mono/diheme cytochrome c family protein